MKYITASIGAVFVFVAVCVLSVWLLPVLPRLWIVLGKTRVDAGILIALALAVAAAVASFRGTQQHYSRKAGKRDNPPQD